MAAELNRYLPIAIENTIGVSKIFSSANIIDFTGWKLLGDRLVFESCVS
jgi:hypothetical protein